MSTWSIEPLDNGTYGLVLTQGKQSRTVFIAMNAGYAAEFLAMAETYALLRVGAPVEAFQVKQKKGGSRGKKSAAP